MTLENAHAQVTMKTFRINMDSLNREYVDVLQRMLDLSIEIQKFKLKHGLPVTDEAREKEVLSAIAYKWRGLVDDKMQKMKKLAIEGLYTNE